MREAVYQRARAALARQLTAVDPPLSTREIETQHQELEDAVAQLEAEYAPDDAPDPDPDFGDLARDDVSRKDDFRRSRLRRASTTIWTPGITRRTPSMRRTTRTSTATRTGVATACLC
jgi:hypothetical protein